MANSYYVASGAPTAGSKIASSPLRSEFSSIEDGFDILPDVSTPNLFAVTDGSTLAGKTATQAKVILSLENVANLDTTNASNISSGTLSDDRLPTSLVAHVADTANPHTVTATQVGLGNCDNTADADKPISTLTQTALNLKANLASPTFTGTVRAPTTSRDEDSASIATTEWVRNLFTVSGSGNGYIRIPTNNTVYDILFQWGTFTTNASANTESSHSFAVAFDGILQVVACGHVSLSTTSVNIYSPSATGFKSVSNVGSQVGKYIAVGYINY